MGMVKVLALQYHKTPKRLKYSEGTYLRLCGVLSTSLPLPSKRRIVRKRIVVPPNPLDLRLTPLRVSQGLLERGGFFPALISSATSWRQGSGDDLCNASQTWSLLRTRKHLVAYLPARPVKLCHLSSVRFSLLQWGKVRVTC